jgi:hypothetical protein
LKAEHEHQISLLDAILNQFHPLGMWLEYEHHLHSQESTEWCKGFLRFCKNVSFSRLAEAGENEFFSICTFFSVCDTSMITAQAFF